MLFRSPFWRRAPQLRSVGRVSCLPLTVDASTTVPTPASVLGIKLLRCAGNVPTISCRLPLEPRPRRQTSGFGAAGVLFWRCRSPLVDKEMWLPSILTSRHRLDAGKNPPWDSCTLPQLLRPVAYPAPEGARLRGQRKTLRILANYRQDVRGVAWSSGRYMALILICSRERTHASGRDAAEGPPRSGWLFRQRCREQVGLRVLSTL